MTDSAGLAERVIRLETRVDMMQTQVVDVRDTVTRMDGKLDTLLARDAKQQGAAEARRALFGNLPAIIWTTVLGAVVGAVAWLFKGGHL